MLRNSNRGGAKSRQCRIEDVDSTAWTRPRALTLGPEVRLPAAEHRRNRFSFLLYRAEFCYDLSYPS